MWWHLPHYLVGSVWVPGPKRPYWFSVEPHWPWPAGLYVPAYRYFEAACVR